MLRRLSSLRPRHVSSPSHALNLVAFALLGASVAPPAAAQALCQLHFDGKIGASASGGGEPRSATGHLVEVEITALAAPVGPGKAKERELVLHIHLANGTTGGDLARMVARRLERLGVDVLLGAVEGGEASLWIEDTLSIALRLGGGIEVDIACAEGPPKRLQLQPPSAIPVEGWLTVAASTALIRRDRLPIRGRASVRIRLAADASPPDFAAQLWEAASKDWVSERPGGDAWRPHKMANGATITGVSFHIDSSEGGDWRIELEL